MMRRLGLAIVLVSLAGLFLAVPQPAWAVPTLTLTPRAGSSLLGNPVTFTATLSEPPFIEGPGCCGEGGPGEEPSPSPIGGSVSFSVGGTRVGAAEVRPSGNVYTATLTYTRQLDDTAGTFKVVAIWSGNDSVSGSAAHSWEVPPYELRLEAGSARSVVGQQASFTAVVSGGRGGGGVGVDFAVFRGGDRTFSSQRTTGSGGRASFSYGSSSAGTDRVVVSIDAGSGDPLERSTEHVWVEPPKPVVLVVTPAAQTVPRGGFCVVRVSLSQGDDALDDRRLDYTISNSRLGAGPSDQVTTNRSGQAAIRWPAPTEGVDTLTVNAADTAPATARCTAEPPASTLTLTLAPTQSDSRVGTPFALEATLLEDGKPVEGSELTLVADHDGALEDLTRKAITADGGKATFNWTRERAGVDTITVTEASGVKASATHVWRARAETGRLQIAATPSRATAQVGTPTLVDTTTRLGGKLESGVTVTLVARMTGQPGITRTRVTDDRGAAQLSYTRPGAGTDVVTVRVATDGKSASATVRRSWTTAPVQTRRKPTITLSPDGTVSQTGERFRVIAVVRADGKVLPDASVSFRAVRTEDPADPLTAVRRTGVDGEASFDHGRTRAGWERIRATTEVDGRRVSAEITHRWTAKPVKPPADATIGTESESARPGQNLTVSGTGCPPGVEVVLQLRAQGAQPILLGRAFADAAGVYRLTQPMPDVPLNRYQVTSSCGSNEEVTVDVVGAEEAGAGGAPAAGTTSAVLLFFLLLGNAATKLRLWLP